MNSKQQTLRDSITDNIYSLLALPESSLSHTDYELITVKDMIHTQTSRDRSQLQHNTMDIPSIYPNEPSTIISYTLSVLQKHCDKNNISYDSIDNVHELKNKINQNNIGEESKYSQNSGSENMNCNSHKDILKFEVADKRNNNSASFRCYLYYAVQFNKLRQQLYSQEHGHGGLFADIETDFIESLSRCSECDMSAGKKGTFCKTLDDKYLLKFIKPDEFKMFLDNFASYYDHMSNTLHNQTPSLLVPIIGAYGISHSNNNIVSLPLRKNKHRSESMRYVLVMPNLFYSKNKNKLKKFDLKGTVNTNRYINDKNDVKLDKNYVEYIRGSPVVLNRQSIHYLSDAIDNDTQFLAESNIMDYSLLIGVDIQTHQVIGGIIDYLEKYSWKKKAEKTIKSLFINDSTVQKPSIYKQRFQESILNKYFVSVQC